jgi:outer membrane protein OmpA-like peptidoglycan-associated protein
MIDRNAARTVGSLTLAAVISLGSMGCSSLSTTQRGAAGAIIGSRMDDRADVLARELDSATIERVGEGILVAFDSGILFGFDSSSLKPEACANLGDLARVLADDSGDYQLLVAGHTDSVGREAYNRSLSERRAQAAADFLLGRGMSSGQVRTQGLGESEPVASNETEADLLDGGDVPAAVISAAGVFSSAGYLAPAGSSRYTAVGSPPRSSIAT